MSWIYESPDGKRVDVAALIADGRKHAGTLTITSEQASWALWAEALEDHALAITWIRGNLGALLDALEHAIGKVEEWSGEHETIVEEVADALGDPDMNNTWHLVNSVRELRAERDRLRAENAKLRADLAKVTK